MSVLTQNLSFAARQLRRNPGFTLTVVLTLALSIGANTAIFSLVNALMLKSLPYAEPERLGAIFMRTAGAEPGDFRNDIDGAQWEWLRDNVPSLLSAVSSDGTTGVNMRAGDRAQYVHDGRISAHYFDVLGIHPALGRNFSEDEDRPDGPPAVILSYALWHSVFAGDRELIGQAIHLKGAPYTVIGVLPQGATTPLNGDVYTALQPSRSGEGGGTNYNVIVRLRPGATWQQADGELNRAWAQWSAAYAQRNHSSSVTFYTVPLQKGQAAELQPKAIGLMLSAGFILLIACANLAGLTLVRIARRGPEMATRLALGASRWQIQRQLWVEYLLLAFLGGVAGVGVGFLALRGLLALLPEDYLPVADVPLDLRVLGFTLAVALLTSVLFGMLPALAVRKVDLRSSMGGRAIAGGERLRLRQALIAGEVALTVVLLAGSGLLIRTLVHLETLPPGFDANGVMTAKASLDDVRYHDLAAFQKLLRESVASMKQIPGVKNAAVGLTLPYERSLNDSVTLHNGPNAGQMVGADMNYATPEYFSALRIPLLAGRAFTDSDGPDTQHVVIVNRAFARKFFGGMNPVGLTISTGKNNMVIVGVVGDVQLVSGLDPIAPIQSEETLYIPAPQMPSKGLALVHTWFQPSWIVRTAAPVSGLTEQMQKALASADPGLPFSGFYKMNDLLAKSLFEQRIEVALLSAMAGLALLLSAVGIFALVASMVAQRTREIGIRIALGSTIRQAMVHVSRAGIGASVAGLAVGLGLSMAALRVMRSVLYGVGVYDGMTLGVVVLTLLGITAAAAFLPAMRIARIDPATTLRDE